MSRRRNKKNFRPRAPQVDLAQADIPASQPVLDAAEQKVESQLLPEIRESYLKIVVAGMRAGLANGPNSILAGIRNSKDPVADCAKGAIGVVLILKHQSKGIMPVKAMIPAATTLMLKALSFADKTGIVKVGNDELVRAAHIFAHTFLEKFGITPPMLQHAIAKAHALTQDPVAMEQMKRKSGLVKHPLASTPTQMPEDV